MNLNLLSQNLLLIVCILATAATVYVIIQLFRPPKRPEKRKAAPDHSHKRPLQQQIILLVASICLAFALLLGISHVTESTLPLSFMFMALPAIYCTGLVVLVISKNKNLIPISLTGSIFSILFSLLLINNYYHLFPTLGQVFGKVNNVTSLASTYNQIEFQTADITHTSTIENSLVNSDKSSAGKVYSLNIPGTISKFNARTAYVYVPPIYEILGHINLPVVVLLPGFPGTPENWVGSGLITTMNQFAKRHNGITPLVFMVDDTGTLTNDTECTDSPRGNVETYLTEDVPNYIKKHFNVETDPSHWAIGGLSMGGMCSIMLTLRHPDVYHYFVDLGGELGPEVGSAQTTIDKLFDGSKANWEAHQPNLLLTANTYRGKGLGGFFGVGNQDSGVVTRAASQLSTASRAAGIDTVYEVVNGQHTFTVWQNTFKLSLPWLSNRLGATDCGGVCI